MIFVGWNELLGTWNAMRIHEQCEHWRAAGLSSAFGVEMVCSSVTGISHHRFLTHLWFSVVSLYHLLYLASLHCTIDVWDVSTFWCGGLSCALWASWAHLLPSFAT